MICDAKGVVDFQDVTAVVREPDRIETEGGEGGRGRASNVELDDRGLDRGPVGELDDVVAAFSGFRPDALRARVLADVDA